MTIPIKDISKVNLASPFSWVGKLLDCVSLRIMTILAIMLVFLIIATLIYQQKNSASNLSLSQHKAHEMVIHGLNEVHAQLQVLSSTPRNSEKQQNALLGLEKEMTDIKQALLATAKGEAVQNISSQLTAIQADIDTHMMDIKKAVSVGQKSYLQPNVLPFHVLAVDVIAGRPYVSVDEDSHIFPLGLSDTLAGWRLIAADFDTGSAEFVNEKEQYIKIDFHEEHQ